MGVPWKRVAGVGLSVAKLLFPAVSAVEESVRAMKTKPSGAEKLAAAEEIFFSSLAVAEDVTDRDLLHDEKVREAGRHALSAYADLMSALAAAREAKPTT